MTWKIRRIRRTDVLINNFNDIEIYIVKSLKLYKSKTKELEDIFQIHLDKEFSDTKEIIKYIKGIFGISGSGFRYSKSQLKMIGYSDKDIDQYISEHLAIKKAAAAKVSEIDKKRRSKFCNDYWIDKGYSPEIASEKVSEFQSKNANSIPKEVRLANFKTRKSNLVSKGYNDNQATNLINLQQRKNSKRSVEYWLSRGHSEESAIQQVSNHQREVAKYNVYDHKNNPRRIEYWMRCGYSESDSINHLAKIQRRDLEFFINKYGEDDGIVRHKAKVDKWKDTLSYKTQEELDDINRMKSTKINFNTLWNQEINSNGILYILKLNDILIKIGITSRNRLSKRYPKHILDQCIDIIEIQGFDLITCFKVEQVIKREFNTIDKSESPNIKYFGWTEIVKSDLKCVNARVIYLFDNVDILAEEFNKIGKGE
jgi:hypothetical protein